MSKIVRLEATNIKRLTAVEVTPDPDGSLVIVRGNNAQGKSSLLDAIEYGLRGKRSIPEEPLRHGTSKGEVVLDLGDLVVERNFRPDGGTSLKVTAADGSRLKSPQAVLDRLCGALTFDPLEFERATPKEQAAQLRELSGLDFRAADAKRDLLLEERLLVGREERALRQRAEAMPVVAAPDEEIDPSAIAAELEAAFSANALVEADMREIDRRTKDVEANEYEIKVLEERLAQARADLAARQAILAHAVEAAAGHAPVDVDSIRARLSEVETVNKAVRANRQVTELLEGADAAQASYAALTAQLAEIDAAKALALAQAELPIDGLAFDSDRVTYKGVEFSQCSHAERLRVSIALGLAAHPDLSVMLIRDGSRLDDESLAHVGRLAASQGAQLWIEAVGEDGPATVVIEHGAVKEVRS